MTDDSSTQTKDKGELVTGLDQAPAACTTYFSPAYELTLTCTLGQGACDATEQLRMRALAY